MPGPDHRPTSARRKEPARGKELGRFLRSHREQIPPSAVGLPETPRRRTPGLRREEVATLAGVGLAWYSWLEQGRVNASKQVLDAIARALRLDGASYRYMLILAGLQPPPADEERHDSLARRLDPLLDQWTNGPAVLLDRRFDFSAWNLAYASVWGDPAELPESRRNLMWYLAADPGARRLVVDWRAYAVAVLHQFRAQTGPIGDDKRVQEVYGLLREDAPDLADWWDCQGVADLTVAELAVRPAGDPVRLTYAALRPVDDPDSLLILQSPADPESQRRLARHMMAGGRPRDLGRGCDERPTASL
ncbi:helix-turn-helix domain-containing protein [Marinitenerispora sediminis]|uniref:XRE family transcriptional regulator n=1 Tax=Marinitenerispora sediminis TaxID=1931232 RepID=A0A368TBT5_9ACTN|nr:helix-turn-helix transcriptional regulator [Marinitenerispora sediminis]RCV55058.1 XRE family transcriptional regulator [Marinitenerispora sediminis]RCV58023.1 XRE family transcriptional regulator [Marinitenerispora sediminis]RCV60704.1 XRE family transcriptional regulator [Marinitenerispora sediminis]